MNAEVVFVGKGLENSVGDGADAELEGGSVGHERGTVTAYGEFHFAGSGENEFL